LPREQSRFVRRMRVNIPFEQTGPNPRSHHAG
jgi:hypothetical protein